MDHQEDMWRTEGTHDPDLDAIIDHLPLKKQAGDAPLDKLRDALFYSMIWAIIITALYVYGLWRLNLWPARATFGIGIVFNLWILMLTIRLWNRINAVPQDLNVIETLRFHHSQFMSWWRIQERTAIFFYPLAAAGGFLAGGVIGSGKSVEALLANRAILGFLIGTLAVLVPLCFWLARWMFRIAYGKHLDRLQRLIDELTET